MKLLRTILLLALVNSFSSCAGVVNVQPQVNGLAIAGRFDQALEILDDPAKYGKNNQLLFQLDRGMVLHLAGRYQESTTAFEQAKRQYEELYTQSISKITGSWLWNDYVLPYRGEDFERVMLNIFESLNFAVAGDINGALVEARDVDHILIAINQQYTQRQQNIYRDDAFAQLLMGMYYEADDNLNDALICYRKSWQIYQHDYKRHYGTDAPLILKENLLAAAQEFNDPNMAQYQQNFSDVQAISWDAKRSKGEIIVIEYAGLAPNKLPTQIPVPLPNGYLSQITFPKYQKRGDSINPITVSAESSDTVRYHQTTQVAEDIAAIAVKNLDDRKIRVITKAVLRPAGKYLLERGLQYTIAKDHGKVGDIAVPMIGTLYNMASERADLRSWQTLPAQIRLARIIINPGQYHVTAGSQDLGPVHLSAGEKKFLIVRTLR